MIHSFVQRNHREENLLFSIEDAVMTIINDQMRFQFAIILAYTYIHAYADTFSPLSPPSYVQMPIFVNLLALTSTIIIKSNVFLFSPLFFLPLSFFFSFIRYRLASAKHFRH